MNNFLIGLLVSAVVTGVHFVYLKRKEDGTFVIAQNIPGLVR